MRRVVALAEWISGVSERHRVWLLTIASALYVAVVGVIAARKQLANDELFTLNIAKLPSLTEVWSALATGAEQLPPFFYVLTRASLSLFGESNLSLRLPAIIGLWVMALSLFRFVSRRSTAVYGIVAMLFPFSTGAYYYAFEARPYGIVLGLAGLAMICWQSLAEGEGRALPLAGLALSLAAAVSCHYYAVLVLIPFACGEAARTISRRRLDLLVWAVMAASLIPLLIFFPLIARARSYSKIFWSQPSWGDIQGFYYFLLMSAAVPLTAVLILSVLYRAIIDEDTRPANESPRFGLRAYEVVAAAGFLVIPFIAVAIAMFVTGAFAHRYALPAVLGVGVLIPFAFHQLFGGREALTLLLVLSLVVGFARRGSMTLQDSAKRAQNLEDAIGMLGAESVKDLPIVCSDPHIFLVLSHYGPPEIRSRLVYLADPDASMRYLGHDSIEQGMVDLLKPWFRLNVQEYRTFITSFAASRRPFLLCGDPRYFLNWVLQDLVSSLESSLGPPGAQIEFIGRRERYLLFLISARKGPVGKEKQEIVELGRDATQ